MAEYVFEIQVKGFDESIRDDLDAFGDLASRLQSYGAADLGLGITNGAVIVDVWRDDCPTAHEALLRTFSELGKLGLVALRVAPDDFITAAELAERLDRSPASIAQLIKGVRGAGGFPAPLVGHMRKSKVYSYFNILTWSAEFGQRLVESEERELKTARVIKTANDALGLIEAAVLAEDSLASLVSE